MPMATYEFNLLAIGTIISEMHREDLKCTENIWNTPNTYISKTRGILKIKFVRSTENFWDLPKFFETNQNLGNMWELFWMHQNFWNSLRNLKCRVWDEPKFLNCIENFSNALRISEMNHNFWNAWKLLK